MLKGKLFLALAIASCTASFCLEAAVAETCPYQAHNQPDPADALYRLALATAVFALGITKSDPEFPLQDIADDLEKAKNDLFPPSPDTSLGELLCQLQDQLQQDTSVLFLHDTLLAINTDTGGLKTAIETAQQILTKTRVRDARLVMPGEEPDIDTKKAIDDALFGNDEWWKRFASPQSNNGGTPWKTVISPASPDSNSIDGKTTTYEWRLAVPYVLNALAVRPHIIEAIDPYWRIDRTSYDSELSDDADKLEEHLTKMKKGVQCNAVGILPPAPPHELFPIDVSDPPPALPDDNLPPIDAPYTGYRVACADIYTGLSQYGTTGAAIGGGGPRDGAAIYFEAKAKSWVMEQMPLFEMQATVDRYRQYVSHAADLTHTLQRIPFADYPGFCLEVLKGSAASGTRVGIGVCQDISAQKWVYDRDNREIYNPRLDKCLEVTRVNGQPVPGTAVVSADCDDSDYQQWTYNPKTQVLSNRFGTALAAPDDLGYATVAEVGSRLYADGPRPRPCYLEISCPSSGF
jgi:hypothetical protein